MKHCSMLRNRMLADPSFLFKVGTEVGWLHWCHNRVLVDMVMAIDFR